MTTLGNRVRDYEVWGLLGRGGMSEVYLAKHPVLAIPVIVKTVCESTDSSGATTFNPTTGGKHDDASIERVLHEARTMAKISDPRVVRAIDAGVHEGIPYLVQEYVDGIDLEELDKRRRDALGVGLPLWFICHVMHDVCGALHSAHQTGVIHRDVKPSNVFGAPETGVRLGDFGIAIGKSEALSKNVSGTLGYMAPEQLRGEATDRATDVFGAGATAFALRYGRYPFPTVDEALDMDKPPSFAPPQNPVVGYFQRLVEEMLTKDQTRRPHCAASCAYHFQMISKAIRSAVRQASLVPVDTHTFRLGSLTIRLYAGDIADAETEGIVQSANYEMKMQSGVGNALRKRGGDCIEEEAMKSGQQPLGSCIATGAGALSARAILHAVSAWNETSCVGRATQRAFLLADELGLKSLTMPALGTGVARVSMERSANAMMTALRWHAMLGGSRLEEVAVVLENEEKLNVFRTVAEEALRDDDDAPVLVDLGLPVTDT
ncbi:MAG: serine/threonine-protein kinase, partial [Polyangiaceae bacterium]